MTLILEAKNFSLVNKTPSVFDSPKNHRTMKSVFLSLTVALLTPLLISATLNFENDKIVYSATLDETEYTATFPFTNKGDTSIEILDVSSSCGCTTALPSKRVFAPGESGEISATFDYGGREGKQRKTIRVETNQAENERIFLTLEIDIPTVMSVSPSVVMWNRNTENEFASKEVTIESHMEGALGIAEIVSSSDAFSHEVRVLEPGKKFAVAIKPENLPDKNGIIRGTFIVKTSYSDPLKGTAKVYAIVR